MKVCVFGLGGVGGFYGGMLMHAGHEVAAVVSPGSLPQIQENGLTVNSAVGSFTCKNFEVSDNINDIKAIDCLIVSTKHYDLHEVARQLSTYPTEIKAIITLQNGLDADLQLLQHCCRFPVVPGCVYIISRKIAPGVIEQSAGPRTIFFGERRYSNNPLLKELEQMFVEAGVAATYSQDIMLALWQKFVWINAFAGITAATRSSIGPLVREPSTFNLIKRMLEESFTVAQSEQIALSQDDLSNALEKFEQYKTKGQDSKSSLLADIEAGSRCELDALLGSLISLAQKNRIATPVTETLYGVIKGSLAATAIAQQL